MKRKIILFGLVALTAVGAAAWWLWPECGGEVRCPSVAALKRYEPPEASRLYTADGSFLTDLAPQRRIVVELEEISRLVREGVVAVEDKRFFSHPGVDPVGVLRAAWHDLRSLSLAEGASTITMQLARNVFPEALPLSDAWRRKIWEVYLALRIEREFSKREILELYLNQVYFGNGLYGVEAAARGYFDRSAGELGPAQAALLIGLIQRPTGYDPRAHPERAIHRRNVVLNVMAREGVISEATAERAKPQPLKLAPPPEAAGPAPYFVAAVTRRLRERFGPRADVRGLRVYTTLDPALQRAAREALVRQIRRIERGAYGRYPHPVAPGGEPEEPAGAASRFLQGAIIALDAGTGAVRALVGGRDFAHSQFGRALLARRQPGSAFKPIVYAAALAQGLPLTARIPTTPLAVETRGGVWRPSDHLADSVDVLSVRRALAVSSNRAAVRVGRRAGMDAVRKTAALLGIDSPVPPYPSSFLGAAEVVPAELAAAYAAFANGGRRVRPHLIRRVENAAGEVLWRADTARRRVLEPGVAFLMTRMLEEVIDDGTGWAASGLDLPAAGKTGTTDGARDVWFVGYTPDLVAAVWLGFDRPKTIVPGATGGRLAAPAWAAFMERAYRTRPTPDDWSAPASLVRRAIDTETGRLATGDCPDDQIRRAYFLPGTAPTESCPLHPVGAVEGFFEGVAEAVGEIF